MKKFTIVLVVLLAIDIPGWAQGSSPNSLGLLFEKHLFSSSDQKEDVRLQYNYQPFPAFALNASAAYGTYSTQPFSDGLRVLSRSYDAQLGLVLYPLYKILGAKAYRPNPYFGVNYQLAFSDIKMSTVLPYNEHLRLSAGVQFHLKKYSSIVAGYNFYSPNNRDQLIGNSGSVQIGLVYNFHHKKEQESAKAYNELSEAFMNSVKGQEQLGKEKKTLIQDQALMEESYEGMITNQGSKISILEASLTRQKHSNEVLLEDNFELELQIQNLKRKLAYLNTIQQASKHLASYEMVHSWANPYLNTDKGSGATIVLDLGEGLNELETSKDQHLMDYEDVFVLKGSDAKYYLAVHLDLSDQELAFEKSLLSQYYPQLFELVGNDN